MGEAPDGTRFEVATVIGELLAPDDAAEDDARQDKRPLPDDWFEDPVKRLIAMVLADPTREGVAVALAWFYGRGLPDPRPAKPEDAVLDVGALIRDVLQRCVDSAGVDVVRAQIADAMGEPR